MTNYSIDKLSPWNTKRSEIKEIIIGSITSIGNYAFYECNQIKSINIPESVISIGSNQIYH